MRIVFMGTPDFAVPSLQMLRKDPDVTVVGVVTQPDRPRGRKGVVTPSPVKQVAQGLPIWQPERVSTADSVAVIASWQPDLIVTVAYGQILKKALLDVPAKGCVNLHASLLPRWRGAAPIQRAIMAGDEETGVTTMYMDEGMDTGDIILQQACRSQPDSPGLCTIDSFGRPFGQALFNKAGTRIKQVKHGHHHWALGDEEIDGRAHQPDSAGTGPSGASLPGRDLESVDASALRTHLLCRTIIAPIKGTVQTGDGLLRIQRVQRKTNGYVCSLSARAAGRQKLGGMADHDSNCSKRIYIRLLSLSVGLMALMGGAICYAFIYRPHFW